MLRTRLRADDGSSLVELLVAVLIIGVLVAVATPLLLGQRAKAQDANAKGAAATAAKAATSFGADRNGFDDVTAAELIKLEPSLGTGGSLLAEGTARTFKVTVESVAGTTYSVARAADGEVTRDCAPAGRGSCRDAVDGRGNRW